MTPFQRLLEKASGQAPFLRDLKLTVHRTYAGSVMRRYGAWAWFATDDTGREILGSQFRITDLLKEPFVVHRSDNFVLDPEPDELGLDHCPLEITPI